jgi:hypothetical protein
VYLPVRSRRWWRHAVLLSGGVSLVMALGAAASPDAAAAPVAAGARSATSGGTWGNGQEVAGALNKGGNAEVYSVSCPSPGNCGAGGLYNSQPGQRHTHAFVVNEVNGTWGAAKAVPEPKGWFDLEIYQISCASAGNCSAGGLYFVPSKSQYHNHAFVVDEVNGSWGKPEEVPGLAALDIGGGEVSSMSCPSAGNCSADGWYLDTHRHGQGWVANEVNGTWRTAEEIPGLQALNKGWRAEPMSVSCASAGNCSASGFYVDGFLHGQAFVVDEVNGTWGKAQEVAGKLNLGGEAVLESVSCASAGNCSGGGGYNTESGQQRSFVVNEANGKWGTAKEVAGAGGGIAWVSCVSAGNCSASGSTNAPRGLVVNEVNGSWGAAQVIPGSAALNSVSCASAGNCSAAGFSNSHAVVVNEVNGKWGTPQVVAGNLNVGTGPSVNAVSCAPAGLCSAGGVYVDKAGNLQAFVASEG